MHDTAVSCTVTANPLAGGATCSSAGTEPLNGGDFVVLIVDLKNPTIANDFTNAAFYTNFTCD